MQGENRGDCTRYTFRAHKAFTRVLMQQGRVSLDADWNEQTAILLRYLQTLAADLVGPFGGPLDSTGNFTTFEISPLLVGNPSQAVANDFRIGGGHYYVDGILCELSATPVAVTALGKPHAGDVQVASWRSDGIDFEGKQYVKVYTKARRSVSRITGTDPANRTLTLDPPPTGFDINDSPLLRRVGTYNTQRDYPFTHDHNEPWRTGHHLVYLDVWERHVTCIQDDAMREVALGGPDTATRAKVVWQVKLYPGVNQNPDPNLDLTGNCPDGMDWEEFVDQWQPHDRGRLKARANQGTVANDPCTIRPKASFRGTENQLYRVEIHRGGESDTATFKWSRDNSSVEFPIETLVGNRATLNRAGRDSRLSLNVDDWVEVIDDTKALKGHHGLLAQVTFLGDSPEVTVTLKPPTGYTLPQYNANDSRHPLLRRWDYQGGASSQGQPAAASDGALILQEDRWLALEDGVQVLFASTAKGQHYRTADHWLIPARTATADVEWPVEKDAHGVPVRDSHGNSLPAALAPHGVEHHYAPLAIIDVSAGNNQQVTVVHDCRKRIAPIAS